MKLRKSSDSILLAKKKNGQNYRSASFMEMLRYAELKDWILLALGILASVFSGMLSPISQFITRDVTDTMLQGEVYYENNTFNEFVDQFSSKMMVGAQQYFYLGMMSFVLMSTSMGCFFTLCERQVHRIRKKFFEAILNQDMVWIDENQIGSLTQKLSSGIDRIKEGASDKIVVILQAFSTVVTGIIIAFFMSWKLTLIMLFLSPFLILSLYATTRAISASIRGQIEAYASAGAIAEEVISGHRTVTAFNAQLFEIERYENFLNIGCKLGIKKALASALFQGLYPFVLFVSISLYFWYGTTLVLQGIVTPGTVFAVFYAIIIGAIRLGPTLPQINTILGAKLIAGEIFKIIDKKPKIDSSSTYGLKMNKAAGRIEFSKVHFSYAIRPNVEVLNDISFTISPGQNVALVGHSGCGKSTVLSLLMRFYDLKSGLITIDGMPIEKLNIDWLRNIVGVVSQEPIVFATTIENNLKMGKENATMEEMVIACKAANAHEFIRKLPQGYHSKIGHGGVTLSGGQKQRLVIARALIREPKILLLDEATSALDTSSESLVQEAIERASFRRTTITIAHRLSTVRNADKIIVMDKGRIVEEGTHNELMSRIDGAYHQLYQAQQITPGDDTKEDKDFSDNEELTEGIRRATFSSFSRRSFSSRRSSIRDNRLSKTNDLLRRSLVSVRSTIDGDEDIEAQDESHNSEDKPAKILDILQFSRPERKYIVSGLLLAVICGLSFPASAVFMGRLFVVFLDILRGQNDAAPFENYVNAIGFFAIGLFTCLSTFGSGYLTSAAGEKMTMRLRLAVFKHILRQDCTYFDQYAHSTGKLTSRLAKDASNVQAAIDQRLADVLQGIVSVIVATALAFYFSWSVAIICVIFSLALVVMQTTIANRIKSRTMRDMQLAEGAARIASESIGVIEYLKTVQALNRQKSVYADFCVASSVPHRLSVIRGLWQSLSYGLLRSYTIFTQSMTYMFGLFVIQAGYATPFSLFIVIEALTMSARTFMLVATYFPEYVRARASAGMMFSMISEQPKIDSLSNAGIITPIKGNIGVSKVHFSYPNSPKRLVLNNISLNAINGKSVALVGPSGCGKSTLIQLLERFYDVLDGNLTIDDTDIRKYNIRHLRNAIAWVEQEPTLFNLSIRDNIAYGIAGVTKERIESAARLSNIHSFIESLPNKYDTIVGDRGKLLSGGQKQRIAIARAIIRDPRILLLDEATSAIDTVSEKIVQEALERACSGRTCLIVAHRLSTIQHADLIVVMKDGRIIESGSHQQLLLRKGLYYRLIEQQSNKSTD
ncbi:ABC transporter transmembrane region domain-containing protein [Ditylenchus destructor]|uniref:ABC-type xenobiotic transporter n=1 Tax=Ditylenchus destructor TaxID=166010 RepID=A0AAD4RDW1_9BILA|nr:ABC transporter transmembrane region domain-containing protein [Ditylenchus destructor]